MKKMKALLFFVDNNSQEILKMWKDSNLSGNHQMVPFTSFKSIEETVSLVKLSGANIIVLAFNLSDESITGRDVLLRLRDVEKYQAMYVSNTGGDSCELFPNLEYHARRNGWKLWSTLSGVKKEKNFSGLAYEKNLEYFNFLISEKNYLELLPVLYRVKDYYELESYVQAILKENVQKESPETIKEVLNYFIDQREDFCPKHGYWVHSVSHFNGKLWEFGLISEIQKFLKISIKGANELSDDNCSGRLIGDFFRHSRYNDNPVDFGISLKDISFYQLNGYEKARIKKGVFDSEEEYLLFQLKYFDNPNLTLWSNDYQLILLEEKKIKLLVDRLIKINNVYNYNKFMNSLYKKQFIHLEKMLKLKTDDRSIKRLKTALDMTKSKC